MNVFEILWNSFLLAGSDSHRYMYFDYLLDQTNSHLDHVDCQFTWMAGIWERAMHQFSPTVKFHVSRHETRGFVCCPSMHVVKHVYKDCLYTCIGTTFCYSFVCRFNCISKIAQTALYQYYTVLWREPGFPPMKTWLNCESLTYVWSFDLGRIHNAEIADVSPDLLTYDLI